MNSSAAGIRTILLGVGGVSIALGCGASDAGAEGHAGAAGNDNVPSTVGGNRFNDGEDTSSGASSGYTFGGAPTGGSTTPTGASGGLSGLGGAGGLAAGVGGLTGEIGGSTQVSCPQNTEDVSVAVADENGDDVRTSFVRRVSFVSSSLENRWTRLSFRTSEDLELTASVRLPDLPTDLLQPGEELELRFEVTEDRVFYTSYDRTLTLGREGELFLFAAELHHFGAPIAPELGYGITLARAEAVCETPRGGFSCGARMYALQVETGGEAKVIGPGETSRVHDLSIFLSSFLQTIDSGSCDSKGATNVGGYKVTAREQP